MVMVLRKLMTYPGVCGGSPMPVGTRGERVEVLTDTIMDFGRFGMYGDAVARLLVRLQSGDVLQVMYADQSPEAAKWLRSQLRKWTAMPRTSRDVPWATIWR